MDLLTLLIAVLAFCLVAWLINRLATDPYRTWGLWVLFAFAIIFACERLGIFALLRSVAI